MIPRRKLRAHLDGDDSPGPSLSITAQAERAFSLWPNKGETDRRPAPADAYVRLEPVPPLRPAVTTFTHESSKV